jgi:hypothetical protein
MKQEEVHFQLVLARTVPSHDKSNMQMKIEHRWNGNDWEQPKY